MKTRKKTTPKNSIVVFLTQLGAMRALLMCAVLAMLVFVPVPGTSPVYQGWALIPTILVPVLAPILFMVLMLDVLMTSVFMTDKKGALRARYRTILFIELALAAGFVLFWAPYFKAMIS